jgi:hypothetical protein
VLIFLTSLPSLALTLFQLTCLVTGAGKNWWCSAYAWVLCAMAIFYAGMLIVAAIMSGQKKEGFEDKKDDEDENENENTEYFTNTKDKKSRK